MTAVSVGQSIARSVGRPLTAAGASSPNEAVDFFFIIGDSLAEGRGSSASSPAAPNSLYVSGSTISVLADPVGGAITGSMWPAWGNEWYAQTGRKAVFVECATGSTALCPDQAGTNWSPSGDLRSAAATTINAAIATVEASPLYRVGNVYGVWVAGPNDAVAGTTEAAYNPALIALADYMLVQIPSLSQIFVVQMGSRNDRASSSAYAAVRAGLLGACTDSSLLRMAYQGMFSYAADALAYMADQTHPNQTGNNLAGKCGAREASKVSPTAYPAAPAIIGSQFFMDTDSATLVSSRTDSHTTASGTKTLVVCVGAVRIASATALVPQSITFNGVAMTLFNKAAGASGSAPTGRADCAVYYLTETAYGSSLSGVTANIVTTVQNTANILSVGAFNLDALAIPSISRSDIQNTTGTTDLTTTITNNGASTAVGVTASAGDSAAAITNTWTNLTEDTDAGGSNGTRAGQVSFAHTTFALSVDTAVGVTTSAAVNAGACLVAAFRGLIDGEP